MNNTLHNGLRVLEFLAGRAEAVSIKEMAEHFQLPNSHVCRLLKSLVEIGYVEQLPGSRKYQVSLKLLNLGYGQMRKERLLTIAPPYLQQLAAKLDAAVFVTRVHCGYSLIIAAEYPALFSEICSVTIGVRHSVTSSACGKVCAAYSAESVRCALLDAVNWSAPGDFQDRRSAFEEELAEIRRQGWAERIIPGKVNAAGVPLFDNTGTLYGALGVLFPPKRIMTDELLQGSVEAALSCGKLISCAMGFSAAENPSE